MAEAKRPRVYVYKSAAHELGISYRTLRRLVAAQKIRAVPLSERRKGIPSDEIERIAAGGLLIA